jgi:hypothetical protein
MAMLQENRTLTSQEIANLVLRIQEEYQATNIRFVEQNDNYCVFSGFKDGVEYFYKFDKNDSFGSIMFDEIL